MAIRALYRTHYQAVEPRLFGLLLRYAASPLNSAYRESLAARLSSAAGERGKRLNQPAAAYLVDAAKHFQFLDSNHRWTWRGHVIVLATPDHIDKVRGEITRLEQVTYAKYYLEFDGAVISSLLKHIADNGPIARYTLLNTTFIDTVFQDIVRSYVHTSTDIQERTALRHQLDQLARTRLQPKTRKHKVDFHIEALLNFGVLKARNEERDTIYELVRAMPEELRSEDTTQTLDVIFQSNRAWDTVAAFLGIIASVEDDQRAMNSVAVAYKSIMTLGLQVCPVSALIDYAIAAGLSRPNPTLIAPSSIIDALMVRRKIMPKEIRFHVDRTGHPAFVIMTDTALEALQRTTGAESF